MLNIDYKYIDELYKLKDTDFKFQYNSSDFLELHSIFDEKYNIRNYNFSFDLSCSRLIDKLFSYYVNPNTLVISSYRDHPSVKKSIEDHSYKDIFWLDKPDEILMDMYSNLLIRVSAQDYSNIFIITYGTHVSDSEVREERFFKNIKGICEEYCDNVILTLDDCQGSLWIDRDYSIFDHILWTAHATFSLYDTGVLISKSNLPILGGYHFGEENLPYNYRNLLTFSDFCLSWRGYLEKATGLETSDIYKAPHIFNIESK